MRVGVSIISTNKNQQQTLYLPQQRKTMNAAFKSATQWMRPAAPLLTHQQTVTRLYRSSLKCMMSWAIQRDIINEEAFTIRQRFEANRAVAPDSP